MLDLQIEKPEPQGPGRLGNLQKITLGDTAKPQRCLIPKLAHFSQYHTAFHNS